MKKEFEIKKQFEEYKKWRGCFEFNGNENLLMMYFISEKQLLNMNIK